MENRADERISEVPSYEAVRTTNSLYVEYASGDRELYDLTTDPHQLENVAGSGAYASQVADLKARLEALKGCVGRACRTAEAGT